MTTTMQISNSPGSHLAVTPDSDRLQNLPKKQEKLDLYFVPAAAPWDNLCRASLPVCFCYVLMHRVGREVQTY